MRGIGVLQEADKYGGRWQREDAKIPSGAGRAGNVNYGHGRYHALSHYLRPPAVELSSNKPRIGNSFSKFMHYLTPNFGGSVINHTLIFFWLAYQEITPFHNRNLKTFIITTYIKNKILLKYWNKLVWNICFSHLLNLRSRKHI